MFGKSTDFHQLSCNRPFPSFCSITGGKLPSMPRGSRELGHVSERLQSASAVPEAAVLLPTKSR